MRRILATVCQARARHLAPPSQGGSQWVFFRGKKLESAARWRGSTGSNPVTKRLGLAARISFSAEKTPLPAHATLVQRLLGDGVFPWKNC